MKLVVAITGASGAIYGIRVLEELKRRRVESHLVVSQWGAETIRQETSRPLEQVLALAARHYDDSDLGARIASGSFRCDGMIIAPCSMKTLAGVAAGYAASLVQRAADVAIKERRRLVLLVRETPLSPIHLENMLKLSRIGVTIMPPVPALYSREDTLEGIVEQTVCRVLGQFGIETPSLKRWKEDPE